MRPALHAPNSPLTNDPGVLGPEHPLVRATEQITVAIDRCVVIGEGRGGLPHSAVARLRRRLLDPVESERWARSLDALCVEAARPLEQCHSIRPIDDPRVVRVLSAEPSAVAWLIREDGDLRGLARAERPVTDACSPLDANSEAALRQELRQIRLTS